MQESLQLRVHEGGAGGMFVYLPGLHGDWTLMGAFRAALRPKGGFAEVTYPRNSGWTLEDYARGVEESARAQKITGAWLVAESFSSLVGWELVRRQIDGDSSPAGGLWRGLILAGGFVRYPWPLAVRLVSRLTAALPRPLLRRACESYSCLACRRVGADPVIAAELREFAQRRLVPGDRQAITRRYGLIVEHDMRPVARRMTLPVFHLSGAIDPIVPWWHVRPWLRRHCPSFRGSCLLWKAGHNVLLDAPERCVTQFLNWTKEG
jgi:pimeloyl-ACP methyl ester carboxylesterase